MRRFAQGLRQSSQKHHLLRPPARGRARISQPGHCSTFSLQPTASVRAPAARACRYFGGGAESAPVSSVKAAAAAKARGLDLEKVPTFKGFLEDQKSEKVAKLLRYAEREENEQTEDESVHPLVDLFGRFHSYLRISLTERCNLRCRYCMPEDGVDLQESDAYLAPREIIEVAKHFVDHGVDKIRLTGGEPLVSPNIERICAEIGRMKGVKDLCITTNGLLLKRRASSLLSHGKSLIS